MKGFSIKSFLIFAGLFFLLNQSKAQCSFNNFNTGDLTPPGVGLFSETMTAGGGDGYSVTVCAGAQYTATTCFASAFDTYLTVFDAAGNVIGFNDDACGTQSTVTWTSTYSGTAWVFIDRWVNAGNNCAHSGTNQQLRVTQNTGCVTTTPSNCGATTVVACGGSYTNQTTIGAVNDINTMSCHNAPGPVPINMPGGDRVYSITVAAGITTIVVNMNNVVDGNDTYAELLFLGNACSNVNCNTSIQYDIAAGQFSNSTNTWTVSAVGPGTFYFVVDAQSTDGIYLYDLAFDCFASGIAFDNNSACGGAGGDAADGDANGLRPAVGGVTTLAARTLNGCNTYTICETMYIENPSNWEWLDHVQFNLDPCYTAIVPATGFAGNFQPGTWVATYTAATNTIDWEFNHNAPQPLWGDGAGGSYNCQTHTNDFCFTTTIATTCTSQADMQIGIVITDDGIGGAGATVVGTDVEVEDNIFLGTVAPQANAGLDDTICSNNPYTLSGSIGGSAASLTWTSTGSGTFSNASSATSNYTPSAADVATGFVTLTLTTNDPAGPCGPAVDQMVLSIDPPAVVTAGPDQTACSLAALTLAGTNTGAAVTTTWTTSGTGTFSNAASLTSTYTPTAADDALGTVTLTITSSDPNGLCGPVTDQMVITFDNTNPTVTCPANQIASTGAGVCSASVVTPNPVTADNCSVASLNWSTAGATVLAGAGNVGTQTFNEGVTTITYTVTDPLGNTGTCSFTVTVNDNQNPTITCPANVSVNANAGSCVATGVALGVPVTADNCGVASVTNNAPASFPLGGTTVTWTVTDVNGLTATCNQTVTVTDNQNPTITCPANITTNTAAGVCTASVVTPAPVTADNCSVAGTTWSTAGATVLAGVGNVGTQTFNEGVTTVTYIVTDGAGLTATCNFTVTVNDNQNPTITCPANQTVVGNATCQGTLGNYVGMAVTADNCGVASVTQAPAAGFIFVGSQVVTLTVTDVNGLTSNCNFTVTVIDNTVPTITCPAAQAGTVNGSCQFALLNYTGMAIAADNCGAPTVTQSPVTGTNVGIGTTVVTLTATDAAGNISTCTFNVVVTDVTAPTITCPANITANTAAGVCTASVINPNPTTADNCSVASTTWSTAGATVLAGAGNVGTQTFNEGVTTVTYIVTDGSGLTATCSYTVTVNDNQNPTITCPAAQTVPGDALCQGILGNYVGMAVTTDNCGVASVTQSPIAGTVFTGVQIVTLTVTDVNGLINTCTFNVTVIDNTVPTITCPAAQAGTVNGSCQFALLNYTGMAIAADNCGAPTVTQSPVTGTNVGVGTTVVTLTATDAAGNIATCTFNVVVTDVTAPTITCPANQTLNVDATCNASLPDYTGALTSDNCGVASVTQLPVVGTVLNGHGTTQNVTLTVTDIYGNTSNCSFTVTLDDITPPTVTCPANQTAVADINCQFTMIDYTGMVITSDNCAGAVTVSQSPVSGTLVSGTQTVTMTATDAAGNTATCTFQVVVTDNTPPTITCPANQTGNADATCQFSIPDYTGLATSTDNCTAVPTITQSPIIGTMVAIGTTVITLTSTDANGNIATCTFNVVVSDVTPPTATCPANQTLPVDATCNASLPDYTGMVTTTDNCGVLSVTQSPVVGTALSGHGTVQIVTITVTDINGLTSTCNFNVTLQDVTPPTVTCPANQTAAADINCQFTMTDYTPMVTTSDNCAGAVTVTQSPLSGTVVSGTQTVTMTATDAAGNTATCTFQVVVTDNTVPTITSGCPANQTVNADASCGFTMTDFTSTVTVTDNCTVAASIVVTQSPLVGATLPLGLTTVTLTATDANGNATTCTFDITVIDNSLPTIVNCPANQNLTITANCDVTLPDFTTTLTVTDNCSPAASITVTQSPVAGTVLSGNGTVQTVTLTATDANANITTCTFDVTVVDGVNPTFVSCTPDQNEIPDVNCQFVLPDYTSLSTVSDNCSPAGSIVVTQSPAVGATISGTSLITLTATDQAGNTATCTFQVILTDGTPPTITSGCPANQTVNADASCGFTMTDFTGSITVTDNCNLAASITITQSPVVGSILPIGPTTVTLTATDMNGNASTCTFDIDVIDNTVPTFVVCPSNQNLTITANCDATLPDYTSTSTVSDNCTPAGTITVTQSPVAGTVIAGNGTVQTITLTATDGNGNIATCTFDVTLVDGVNPTIVACVPNQNEIPDANCQFTITDYTSLATVTDNCVTSTITVTQSPIVGTVITGTTTITLTATDQDGNASTCTFDVILADATPPTITSGCPANQNVNADATCGFSLTDFTGSITVTDNCNTSASVVITQSPVVGTLLPLGTTTVTLTATDLNGNASTCTFDVTVTDATPPTITCPANITSCDPVVTYIAPIGTDNCSGSVTTQTDVTGLTSGSTFPIGTTTLTYTVTDGAGLTTSCSFDVIVVDISVSPSAGNDVTYCDTDVLLQLTGTATAGGNLTWFSDPALTNVLGTGSGLTPNNTLGTTTYYLSEDISGCNSNPDSVNVTINVCDTLELTIPTGFTPADADGVNDVWELINLNLMFPNCTVQVYGRWGGLIFESVGYATPWDGTYKGTLMPLGSYYFVIDLGNDTDPIKGTVTIIN